MSEIQKIKIGEQEYTLTDGNALPVPESAKVGQTVVVTAVDDSGKPTAWKCADLPSGSSSGSNVEVAVFDYNSETDQLACLTHTAAELLLALHMDNIPVIGIVVDHVGEEERTVMVGNYNGGICVGCPVGDGNWIHAPDLAYSYADGDVSNKTSGNEIWNGY